MNVSKLQSSLGTRVRLRPLARRSAHRVQIDDDWILEGLDPRGALRLSNTRTGHICFLTGDQIYHFENDLNRHTSGLRFGFLHLKVQILLTNTEVKTERLPRNEIAAMVQTLEQKRPETHPR